MALALSLRWQGKDDALGEYPLVTLNQARELHFAVRKTLAAGIDPMAERKAEADAKQRRAEAQQREAENSFENVARKWWEWWSMGKSPRHADTVKRLLEADVYPAFGHKFIDAITAADVRELMLAIERRDARDVAKRAHETTSQIFRFAIARDIATRKHACERKQSQSVQFRAIVPVGCKSLIRHLHSLLQSKNDSALWLNQQL